MKLKKTTAVHARPLARRVRWDRPLWGIIFTGLDRVPTMIGSLWHKEAGIAGAKYKGEPTRALLFCTRRQARDWCAATNKVWAAYNDGIVEHWRVHPVQVREVVTPNGVVFKPFIKKLELYNDY